MIKNVYLYGKNSLQEAINSKKEIIEKIYLTKQASTSPLLVALLQKNRFDYETVTGEEIERMVGKEALHQGVCAILDEKQIYKTLDEALQGIKNKTNPIFVLFDELQDPHNVGAVIRSSVAFGVDAVLLSEHNQAHITGTVIKASSGMVFKIPIVKIGNINTTIKKLKEEKFWIYGLSGDGDTKLQNVKFDSATVIIVGGEGTGIHKKTLEECDFRISIEIDKKCESLNASNAVAVTLYEFRKQVGNI